jgi:hypothetical protein
MSLPKRHIEIDPSTPFEEVTRLLGDSADEVEVKSGPELFVIHRAAEAEIAAKRLENEATKPNAVDAMSEFAGSWASNEAIDNYLKRREEQKKVDIERYEHLWRE